MQYDDMHNKLALALQSGEGAPDIADIELGKFLSFTSGKKKFRDLTDVIRPYKERTSWLPRLNIYSKDGKYYSLPTHVGTEVAFYNTKELQKVALTIQQLRRGTISKLPALSIMMQQAKNLPQLKRRLCGWSI